MLTQGAMEITPLVGKTRYTWESEDPEDASTHLGLALGAGVNESINVRARVERLENEGDPLYSFASLGLKVGGPSGRLAFELPICGFFGEDVNERKAWHVQPTVLMTHPLGAAVDLNTSLRLVHFFNSDEDLYAAATAGLGLKARKGSVVFRPEVAYMKDLSEDLSYFNFGLGLSFIPSRH